MKDITVMLSKKIFDEITFDRFGNKQQVPEKRYCSCSFIAQDIFIVFLVVFQFSINLVC